MTANKFTDAGLSTLVEMIREEIMPQDHSPPAKADIGYTATSAYKQEKCGGCAFYREDSTCTLLDDTVSVNGRCNFYVPGGPRPNSGKGLTPDEINPTGGHQ